MTKNNNNMRKTKRKMPYFVHCIKERKATELSYMVGSRENRAKNYGNNSIGSMISDKVASAMYKLVQEVA